MTLHANDLTVILGGTGKTGRRVAQRLAERGLPLRVGSRAGQPPFDWQDRTSWAPVLEGARAVYLCYAPDLAVPGAGDSVAALTALAVRSGARSVVLLSGRGEPDAQAAEQAVQAAAEGACCTVLRASWFDQNFSEGYLLDDVLSGELALPVGDVPEPFVDTGDLADVAVAALTDQRHDGQVYELTGPRLLTFTDAAADIAAATGRPLPFRSMPAGRYAERLADQQLPPDVVALLGYLFAEVLDGRNAHLGDGVQRALGRPARDFADWARDAAAAGAWRQPVASTGR